MTEFLGSLSQMLDEYNTIKDAVPPVLVPLMHPFYERVEAALAPGLTHLSWTSLNIESCKQSVPMNYTRFRNLETVTCFSSVLNRFFADIQSVYKEMGNLKLLSARCKDILDSRIEAVSLLPHSSLVFSILLRRCWKRCR